MIDTKQIIELLENIDQLLNDDNIDDAQIEIALWLRTFYKLQAQQKESLLWNSSILTYINLINPNPYVRSTMFWYNGMNAIYPIYHHW